MKRSLDKTREVILQILDKHGPNYGLGIWELLRANDVDVSQDIYSILHSMERSKLLSRYRVDVATPHRNNPPRVYYKLTDDGRAWLEKRR